MNKFDVKTAHKTTLQNTSHENDPYADAEERTIKQLVELDDRRHNVKMMLWKVAPPILIIFGVLFLLILFFVILPFSIIELGAENWSARIQNYSVALLSALGSLGITIVAVLISELIKQVFTAIRKKKNE